MASEFFQAADVIGKRDERIAELEAENARLKQEVENWKTSAAGWQKIANVDAEALSAAGYRILGPDEVDPVTVEKAAEVAANWGSEIPAEIRAIGQDVVDLPPGEIS